jgi:hypothetical protein
MPEISDAERALLEAIEGGKEAWSAEAGLVEGGHEAGTLERLESLGLIERWPKAPGGPAVTLTPDGEKCCRLEIRERPTVVKDVRRHADGRPILENGKPVPIDVEDVRTYWGPELPWGPEDREPRRPPIHLPPRRHEYRMPFPEMTAEKRPGPEYLLDEYSEEPIRLFGRLFDGTPTQGVPIVIDRRLGPKKGRAR